MARAGIASRAAIALVHTIVPALSIGASLAAQRALGAGPPGWGWIAAILAYPLAAALAIVVIGIVTRGPGPAAEPEFGGAPGTER